jgi:hypothetical protein
MSLRKNTNLELILSRIRMVNCSHIHKEFRIDGNSFFNQVLNVRGVHNVRQMDIHTDESLVPEPTLVKVEIAIGKLKSYKSPGTDQIPVEMIKAGGET